MPKGLPPEISVSARCDRTMVCVLDRGHRGACQRPGGVKVVTATSDPMSDAHWLGEADRRVEDLERAITEHRNAIRNAGTVKVQPGYEPVAGAKHRADKRLWSVLDGE